jgi:hypothetical protein
VFSSILTALLVNMPEHVFCILLGSPQNLLLCSRRARQLGAQNSASPLIFLGIASPQQPSHVVQPASGATFYGQNHERTDVDTPTMAPVTSALSAGRNRQRLTQQDREPDSSAMLHRPALSLCNVLFGALLAVSSVGCDGCQGQPSPRERPIARRR